MKKYILTILLLVVVMSFSATAQKHLVNGIKFSRHHFVDTVKIGGTATVVAEGNFSYNL